MKARADSLSRRGVVLILVVVVSFRSGSLHSETADARSGRHEIPRDQQIFGRKSVRDLSRVAVVFGGRGPKRRRITGAVCRADPFRCLPRPPSRRSSNANCAITSNYGWYRGGRCEYGPKGALFRPV